MTRAVSQVHLVGPPGLTDPARPSGGNVYDLRLARALVERGVRVDLHESDAGSLDGVLTAFPDGSTVVVDGIIGSAAPDAIAAARGRLHVVVLVHLPLGLSVDGSAPRPGVEARALAAAEAVVCTSEWTRDWLAAEYGLRDVHVVPPGVSPAPLARPSATGSRLLSVGAITPVKGHDVLVAALASLADLRWSWALVGASVDAAHATALWSALHDAGLDDRVTLAGALTGPALAAAYSAADLVVLPSRHETYGMVATEALARGVPVLASDVGGVREALGSPVPGITVPADDAPALAAALREWLGSPDLRVRLRGLASDRRSKLTGWDVTAADFLRVLEGVGSG